jgi:hypothetical protein
MLALAAFVPQTVAYDALILALIPHSRREALAFGFLSFGAVPFLMPEAGSPPTFAAALAHNQTVYLVALYLPALAAVLGRANVSPAPEVREQVLGPA